MMSSSQFIYAEARTLITVLDCIATKHDPRLIALAMLVCGVGSIIATNLAAYANRESGSVKAAWVFLAAIVVGTTAWATHFVALLGYSGGTRVTYDAALTIASLILAIAGAVVGVGVASMKAAGPRPAIGGALLGLSVAGMHYLGMLAYKAEGVVRWNVGLVAASLMLAAALGSLSLVVVRRSGRHLGAVLLAGTIASLHFTGMSALEIIPLSAAPVAGAQIDVALALSTAAGASLILAVGALNFALERRSRRSAEEKLAQLARTDSLTELPNRLAAHEELRRRIISIGNGEHFAILVIEIFNIDAINQQLGSAVADRVIQATAQRLIDARKGGVFLARMSGSQFCGIGAVGDRDDTRLRAEKVFAALSQDLLIEAHDVRADVRIGAVVFPADGEDAETLLRKAQVALARAAADPLEPIALHDEELDVAAKRRLALSSDLRGALDRREFELHYQPQVWIEGRRLIGCEALIRWRHPRLGMISPAEFIPMAERTGLILPIGAWVLKTACLEAAKWPTEVRVAVNLSPLQLRDANLTSHVAEALKSSGLEPDRLEVELTESLLVEDRARAVEIFVNIKALKVRLVLDDFGTGYSSMEVLRQFPFDKIKLDRSFINEIESNDQSRAILQAMLTLGRALSTPILVEGVETDRQLAILRNFGCNKVQGYLTGRPGPPSDLAWNTPEPISA